ncbi:MAG: hypothetical protein NTNFB02_35360 [Nitrospira sp.]
MDWNIMDDLLWSERCVERSVRGMVYQIPRPIRVTLNASHPKSPTAMTVSRLTEESDLWSGAEATLESIAFSSG